MTVQERIASNRRIEERVKPLLDARAAKVVARSKIRIRRAFKDLVRSMPAEDRAGLIEIWKQRGGF